MDRQVEHVAKGSGERVDRALTRWLDSISRSEIQRWIQAGQVTVNSQVVKASQRLEAGDVVRVMLPEEEPENARLLPWPVPLNVVHEDDDCVVVDKPAGMVVHPATSHKKDTLVNALLARYPGLRAMADPGTQGGDRPGIVHRLDRDTSGLIVIARHAQARQALQQQFKARTVDKVYLALVYGRLSPSQGIIAAPIGRDPRHRKRMAVVPGARQASTEYIARQYMFSRYGVRTWYTLVEAHLLTGRTHQIRVHLAHLGHPVVGDRVYGPRKQRISCPRQFLHAHHLGFQHPADGTWMTFESPLPKDLQQVLSRLEAIV